MNQNISWGKIVVLVVAIVGIGALGFVMGRQKSEVAVVAPITPAVQPVKKETSEVVDEKVYRNEKYGFNVTFPSKAKIATECFAGEMYPEYVFADKQVRCASEDYYAQDPSGAYDEQGAQFSATVFDLKKECASADVNDQKFCEKYSKVTTTKGEAQSSSEWPTGIWLKNDNYVIFFDDFGFHKDTGWRLNQFSILKK